MEGHVVGLLNGSDFRKWSRMMKVSVEQEAQTTMDDEERTKTQDARGKSSGRDVAEEVCQQRHPGLVNVAQRGVNFAKES